MSRSRSGKSSGSCCAVHVLLLLPPLLSDSHINIRSAGPTSATNSLHCLASVLAFQSSSGTGLARAGAVGKVVLNGIQ